MRRRLQLAEKGWHVIGYNRSREKTDEQVDVVQEQPQPQPQPQVQTKQEQVVQDLKETIQ